jgi:hypothetical protein
VALYPVAAQAPLFCMYEQLRSNGTPAATSIVHMPCGRLAGFGHHNLWIAFRKYTRGGTRFQRQTLTVRRLSLMASKWPKNEGFR